MTISSVSFLFLRQCLSRSLLLLTVTFHDEGVVPTDALLLPALSGPSEPCLFDRVNRGWRGEREELTWGPTTKTATRGSSLCLSPAEKSSELS